MSIFPKAKPLAGKRKYPLPLRLLFFFVAYLLGALLSTRLVFHADEVVVFWPPSGIMLGTLIVASVAEWPAFLMGAVLASVAFEVCVHQHHPGLGVVFAASNFVEAAVGAWFMCKFVTRAPRLDRGTDLASLGFLGIFLPAIGATLGLLAVAHAYPGTPFWRLWPLWWRAETLGILIFTPLAIAWSDADSSRHGIEKERPFSPEALLYYAMVVLAAVAAFGGTRSLSDASPYPYLTFLVLLWGAMRLRPKALTLGLALLAAIVSDAVAQDAASMRHRPDVSLLLAHLQGFLAVCEFCTLLLGAVVANRRMAEAKVKLLNESLERRVHFRTAELEESQSRYRDLARISPVGIFRADAQKRIVYVNERWCEITGCPAEEAIRGEWLEAIHPEDREQVLKRWQARNASMNDTAIDFRFQRPNGEIVWVMSQVIEQVREDGVVQGYIGSLTEVSERKQAELALQEMREHLEEGIRQRTLELSESNQELKNQIAERDRMSMELNKSHSTLRAFFDSAPMMMGIVEVVENDILFVSLNAAAPGFVSSSASETGGPPGGLSGRTASALGWSAEEVKTWIAACRESEWRRKPQRLRQHREVDGESRDFDAAVAFLGPSAQGRPRYCYVADDVTEIARAREKQERFQSILEATTDVVGMADRFGRLFYINRAGRRVLGLDAEAPLGGTSLADLHAPWAANLVAREGLPLAMLEGAWHGETAMKGPGEAGSPSSELILAHKSGDGSVEFVSAIIRDISEQKEAEAQVKASLEEKEVLLKEIHHRVKNNLQIVSSLLQLQSSYIRDPESLKIFEESRDRIKSMALIHEQLYQSNDLAKIDFPEYLRSLLHMVLAANRSQQIRIDTRLHVDPVSLDLDTAIPVGLITNELVTNSLKYAFKGREQGEITVRLSSGAPQEYQLSIADDGVGLPEDFSFQKAQSLGLRLVRILTKQMRGSLEVMNGQGTEFRIQFKGGSHP